MTEEIKQVKTLSTKTLGFNAKEIRKLVDGKNNEKIFLARIGGVVRDVIKGESAHGEYTMFKGIFFAVNNKGERYGSDSAFLPSNVTKKVAEGFTPGVIEIDLPPVDIFAVETDKNASGYAYHTDFMMSDDSVKKAEVISGTIFNTKLPGLPAPKAQAKLEGKKAS